MTPGERECVCEREREREREKDDEVHRETDNAARTCWSLMVVSREHLGFRVYGLGSGYRV